MFRLKIKEVAESKGYKKPRHGWFTNPGSEDDRGSMCHERGKIVLCSEQILAVTGLFP
jgi:hypothetical protein